MHHDRARRPHRLRQQRERLGRAGGEQHLGGGPAVPGAHGLAGGPVVGVAGEVRERGCDRSGEPGRVRMRADVHGEVDESVRQLAVAVEAQRAGQLTAGRGLRVGLEAQHTPILPGGVAGFLPSFNRFCPRLGL